MSEPFEDLVSCPQCRKVYILPFGSRPKDGRTIQKQFPSATPIQREMYMTGLCSDSCWDKYLGGSEEE